MFYFLCGEKGEGEKEGESYEEWYSVIAPVISSLVILSNGCVLVDTHMNHIHNIPHLSSWLNPYKNLNRSIINH